MGTFPLAPCSIVVSSLAIASSWSYNMANTNIPNRLLSITRIMQCIILDCLTVISLLQPGQAWTQDIITKIKA
uniref:Putative secreted protein n=1 Tax=Panstrongylus lignarius TaxID=156445 RepID=A0A224XXJ2_9HEMI